MSVARVVLQAVDAASLLVDNAQRYVSIREGVIVYVTFLSNATEAGVSEIVSTLVNTKIFALPTSSPSPAVAEHEDGKAPDRPKPVSLLDSVCDVLVIPQASLAGKAKGKVIQYHSQAQKDLALQLYKSFCAQLRASLGVSTPSSDASPLFDENGLPVADGSSSGEEPRPAPRRLVLNGTYGNRQGLQFASRGPFSHILDF